MSNIIIGTAGHVDHGKTLLIKALTGIDTDRLKEEKKRGITIELGFAWLDLPNGVRAGIVDVPGHEKFIKNMLAGAGGIDLALLVIAADDGVMPQTREHLGILRLLGIQNGMIVITKADLVEPDWLEMVKEDIRVEVKGTFLEDAPIQAVSAYTGQGIHELKEMIVQQLDRVPEKNVEKPFRMPIDRVFTVSGFGKVVTGTMIEGTLREGDEIELYPSGLRSRVRTLQVHSKDVSVAYAGQRVAVNLAGIKEEVSRGETLAAPESMQNTLMLDVKLEILPDSGRIIENGSRLHFYLGSRDVLCKVVLLDADVLEPGQTGYAQLRFTEEIAAKKGDHFVVRFYSPIETVGGGIVLDSAPPKHRRHHARVLQALEVREHGSLIDNLLQMIVEGSMSFVALGDIQKQMGLDDAPFREALHELTASGRITMLGERNAIDTAYKQKLQQTLTGILQEYHTANPLQAGMRRDELRSRLLPGRNMALVDKVLAMFAQDGLIVLDNQKAALSTFQVKQSASAKGKLAEEIEVLFREAVYCPPSTDELNAKYPNKIDEVQKVMEALIAEGTLVPTTPKLCFHKDALESAKKEIAAYLEDHENFTLAQFRDLCSTSRKFATALLEYFDRHGVTKLTDGARVLLRKG